MEITKPIATLRTDDINTSLIELLSTQYIVITSSKDEDIILELYEHGNDSNADRGVRRL